MVVIIALLGFPHVKLLAPLWRYAGWANVWLLGVRSAAPGKYLVEILRLFQIFREIRAKQ